MNYTNRICMLFLSSTLCIPVEAKKVVLEDFENYQLGQELSMVNRWGQNHNSRCVVEKDPVNANNKVLHIYLNDWNTYFPITLPDEFAGEAWKASQDYITFDLRRSASDENDWKKFIICQGENTLWEDDGYPHQGDKNVWQSRTYALNKEVPTKGTQWAL